MVRACRRHQISSCWLFTIRKAPEELRDDAQQKQERRLDAARLLTRWTTWKQGLGQCFVAKFFNDLTPLV